MFSSERLPMPRAAASRDADARFEQSTIAQPPALSLFMMTYQTTPEPYLERTLSPRVPGVMSALKASLPITFVVFFFSAVSIVRGAFIAMTLIIIASIRRRSYPPDFVW